MLKYLGEQTVFKYIRIQMMHPCRARCAWCSTHRKNKLFQQLQDDGRSADFHQTYLDVLERFKPEEVFISGGEPLLEPTIETFLHDVARHTSRIHVFTSYQFSAAVMAKIAKMTLPDIVTLNHTPIYFEPDRWHHLTRGFPFEVYLNNIRQAVKLKVRKRFKFIINHRLIEDEIRTFQDAVEPDETCEISLKIMNDQGDGLMVDHMKKTSERLHDRLPKLDEILARAGWSQGTRPKGSADLMRPVVESQDVTRCPYRKEPLELRLSYDGGERARSVLKYRYCPYFPPEAGHRFHIGRDRIDKMAKNFEKGPFREHCSKCRLLHYTPPCEQSAGRSESQLVVIQP